MGVRAPRQGGAGPKVHAGRGSRPRYLKAGLIDEPHFPVVLGRSDAMFAGLDLHTMGFKVTEHVVTELATHVVLGR
jgi:hypothetical protein